MEYLDLLNFLLRSVHVVAGIAWIGASFYFVMLDSSLAAPTKSSAVTNGVHGELWAVHGGGIYHSQKYLSGPKNQSLPRKLHWSKWEAYSTWISGISLMILVYWLQAEIYLVDSTVMVLTKLQAVGISIGFLLGFWIIYDALCRLLEERNNGRLLSALLVVVVGITTWGLCSLFGGRGAYITFGAVLGSTMVANVFFVIIPGQKKMLASIQDGGEPDFVDGARGKQRSVHNTYFTLPVLFCMLVNHYPVFYSHEVNWLILMAISLAACLIRQYFVSRHGENPQDIKSGLTGGLLLAVTLAFVFKPIGVDALSEEQQSSSVDFAQVRQIVTERCTACHSAQPTYPGFASAPKGVVYSTDLDIANQANAIYQQAVALKAMPIGNLTQITDEERKVLGQWYQDHIKSRGK